ncbi:MAG: hypothetical protein J0L73_19820 [Verrucomicrobia bacterium]|nr:hypothetical protein [Verrucomicrobiota bacterium]
MPIVGAFHCISLQLLAADAPEKRNVIDSLFQRWEKTLPEPTTISEMNGMSPRDTCAQHDSRTYGFLGVIANQVPIREASDLTALVPWSRHDDLCIRQIALDAIVKSIEFDRDELVVPSMHDLEDYHYHHIMVALGQYLRQNKVSYDGALFDGMYVTIGPDDVAAFASGRWEQEDKPSLNFRDCVEFSGTDLVMGIMDKNEGQWRIKHRGTSKVDSIKITPDQQMLISTSNQVSPDKKITQMLWPVAKDIMWFKQQGSWNWTKFRRAK